MKKFKVLVTPTFYKQVEVMAEDEEEAEMKAINYAHEMIGRDDWEYDGVVETLDCQEIQN